MGRRLLTIALLIGSLAAATAAHAAGSDPHAKKPAADAHAPKKSAAHAAPAVKADAHPPKADAHAAKTTAVHAAKPAHAAAAGGPAPAGKPLATDLNALKDRINERVAEVRKVQQTATTAKPRPHGASAHGAEQSVERVRVVWKISVAWPEELQPRDEATKSGERVSVSWEMAPGPRP
jgi:hypothetical protein